MTHARLTFEAPRGAIAAHAWGAEHGPAEVLFLHANGFNGFSYRGLLEPIGARAHVLAIDLRGHGRTSLPARALLYGSWRRHRDDVIHVIERGLERGVVLAGHSLGATVALLVAGARPDLVRGLALLEPVLLPPFAYRLVGAPGMVLALRGGSAWSKRARRRQARFASAEAAYAALSGRGIFRSMPEAALRDYLEDGLRPAGEGGGVELACRPHYEAATYAAQRNPPWRSIRRAPDPFVVLAAETGSTAAGATLARLASLRPDARIAQVEGATHALPWERPDRARAAIETALVMARRAPWAERG